jgi:hypothetical protein
MRSRLCIHACAHAGFAYSGGICSTVACTTLVVFVVRAFTLVHMQALHAAEAFACMVACAGLAV